MPLLHLFLWNLAAVSTGLLVLWVVSVSLHDASIIDLFWGMGFILIAWFSLGLLEGATFRNLLLASLVTIWGLRLFLYLAYRNWGEPEDYRYAKMRQRHGSLFPLVSLFTVFLLQGVLMCIVGLPIQAAMAGNRDVGPLVCLGVVVWGVGLAFETVGDYQLVRFKADPRNKDKVLDKGLWRYTRHPNYFGDFLVWWGLYLIAAESGSWWWTIIGPVLMSILLLRVSGVTLLEQSLKQRKPDYERYVQRTNAFIPWPPQDADYVQKTS